MLDRIVQAFKAPSAPRALDVDTVDEIVKARSHGNVRLQFGDFYTDEDVDRQFTRLSKVDFLA